MKLKSLKLNNFRQHEDSYIEFPDGITVINGQNGAGKSTILEAISWAIYGTEAARGNKDTIRFNRAKPRSKVFVELIFSIDNELFTVKRFLDKAEIYTGENPAPIVTTQQEVTKYLTDKLGMTKDEFFNTYFTGQKELNFLGSQKPLERRKFISRVLNYEKIRETQEKVRIDKNNLDREIKGMNQGLEDVGALKQEKESAIKEFSEIKENVDIKQKEFNKITEELSKIEPEWEKIKGQKDRFERFAKENELLREKEVYLSKNIENIEKQINLIEEKRKELKEIEIFEEKYKTCEKEIRELEKLQEQDNLRQKHVSRIEDYKKDLVDREKLLEEIIKSGKEKGTKVNQIPEIKKEIDGLNREIQELEKEISNKFREIEVLIQQKEKETQKVNEQLSLIESKGEDGACPTCERPLKDEFNKVTGNFKNQINILNQEIEKLEQEKTLLDNKKPEIKEKIEFKKEKEAKYTEFIGIQGQYEEERKRYLLIKSEIDQKTKDIEESEKILKEIPGNFDIEKLKHLREEIRPLREKYENILSLKVEIASFEKLDREIKEHKESREKTDKRIRDNEIKLKELDFNEEKFIHTEKKHHEVKNIFYKAREELIKIQAEESNIKDKLARIEKNEKTYEKKILLIKEKQENLNILSELDRFYGHFWEKLNNEARPEISEIASKLLAELTDGRYSQVELTDKYEIQLHDDGEIKPVISGGEEDIVNLCVRLAISQIIAQRSGKTFSLLILDEIFGALDESRRNNVVNLLRNLTNNFEQIILITHIEDIKEEIDNFITIEFDSETGSSSIS